MMTSSQSRTRPTTRSPARRTPPRTADPTRLPPNKLARNDARNGRVAQRIGPTEHAQRAREHERTAHAHDTDETHRRRYTHEKFRPEQIARALRQSKGGIAAAARVLGCARNTLLRHLNQYPELRATAQEEVELALDLAEQSLFVDAASGDPEARRFLLLTRGRDRGYIIRREVVAANGHPPNAAAQHNSLIIVGGNKQEYLEGLRKIREAARAAQGAPNDASPVSLPGEGHGCNGDAPG